MNPCPSQLPQAIENAGEILGLILKLQGKAGACREKLEEKSGKVAAESFRCTPDLLWNPFPTLASLEVFG